MNKDHLRPLGPTPNPITSTSLVDEFTRSIAKLTDELLRKAVKRYLGEKAVPEDVVHRIKACSFLSKPDVTYFLDDRPILERSLHIDKDGDDLQINVHFLLAPKPDAN